LAKRFKGSMLRACPTDLIKFPDFTVLVGKTGSKVQVIVCSWQLAVGKSLEVGSKKSEVSLWELGIWKLEIRNCNLTPHHPSGWINKAKGNSNLLSVS
jgi:hypothetical protein